METKSRIIQKILFGLIIVIMVLPFFQNQFEIFKLRPLKGDIKEPLETEFSLAGWWSGEYQEATEKYINETFGLRSFLVRINNQIAFWLFKKANAKAVVVGKENFLYEENYINAYNGLDFIGEQATEERFEKLVFIQDTMNKLGKTFITIFSPGKASYYPEYFPPRYDIERSTTNYAYHVKLAEEKGIKYIDFNSDFIEKRATTPYPLFPKYGIHWSRYGMGLAVDSIVKYVEKDRNIDMPNIFWDEVITKAPDDDDYDIGHGMNLLFRLPSFDMGYPHFRFESDSGKVRPSILVIADSFYWGLYSTGIHQLFSNDHYWFYFADVHPDDDAPGVKAHDLDLAKEIEKHDVIIIMGTEAQVMNIGWGFIEKAYDIFKGKSEDDMDAFQFSEEEIRTIKNRITADEKWMNHIKAKAEEQGVSVDSMLIKDAIWILREEMKSKE